MLTILYEYLKTFLDILATKYKKWWKFYEKKNL